MHILLTDILTCPRCGPDFGLILLADRMEDREVVEGSLGCANCREQYRIEDGIVDLRIGPAGGGQSGAAAPGLTPAELAMRYAALLGVTQGPATLLLIDVAAPVVREIAGMLEGVQIILATTGEAPPEETPGALRIGDRLPIRGRSMRGTLIAGPAGADLLREGARTLAPGARLVLDQPTLEASELLSAAGLSIVLQQEGVVVAVSG